MQIIGMQKDGAFYKVAALTLEKKQVILDFVEKVETKEALHTFLQQGKEEKATCLVSGIRGQDVIIRQLKTPLLKKSALLKTLPFQLETVLPRPVEEMAIRPIFHRKGKEMAVTIFAVSHTLITSHLGELEKDGIDPERVSATPMALYRFAEFFVPFSCSYTVFHIGQKSTYILFVEEKRIEGHFVVSIGMDDFLEAFYQDRLEEKALCFPLPLDLKHLSESDFPHLYFILHRFKREVDRVFGCSLCKDGKQRELQVLFTGESDTAFSIEKFLLGCKLFPFRSLKIEGHRSFTPLIIKPYAIPIGLSLDVIRKDEKTIEFREGIFLSKRFLVKCRRKILQSLGFCMAFVVAIFFAGRFLLHLKEKDIERHLNSFLAKHYETIPSLKKGEQAKDLLQKIQNINQQLLSSQVESNYFAPPPLVTDLLVYLSSHPLVIQQNGEKRIQIHHVQYELIEFPSLEEPHLLYKGKVILLFTSPYSQWATEFYDALVKGDDFVDSAMEIEWDRRPNEYFISFYIRT